MKPAFAIVDWDMFVRPICCYVGPDEVPKSLYPRIRSQIRKSRYDDAVTLSSVVGTVREMANDDRCLRASTRNGVDCSFIRIWSYSDDVLAHEILHVIQDVVRVSGVYSNEFDAYALQWLLGDFRYKLTGRFDKTFHFRRRR